MKYCVYAVEDDESIRELYHLTFVSSGFEIETFESAEDMLSILDERPCDAIIMDLMLPGMDGMEAVRQIRGKHRFDQIPIIIISAKGDEINKVSGLDAGADDYMSKPFGVLELVARVRANLRKTNFKTNEDTLSMGEIVLNDKEHIVSIRNIPVNLTLKEYNLLKLFLENPEQLVTRAQLLQDIWGYDFIADTRTLDMHVMSLRNKIAQCTEKKYIHTVRGVGYKFYQE